MYINFLVKQGFVIDEKTIEQTGYSAHNSGSQSSLPAQSQPYKQAVESLGGLNLSSPAPTSTPAPAVSAVSSTAEIVSTPSPQIRNIPDGSNVESTVAIHKVPGQTVLISNYRPLWAAGMPVVITETQLVRVGDDESNVYLNVGIQNLSSQCIVAVYVDIRCYNLLKQQRQILEEVCFMDIHVQHGAHFFTKRPVELGYNDIRRCEVVVRNIVYANEEIWSNTQGIEPVLLPKQTELELTYSLKQIRIGLAQEKKLSTSELNYRYLYAPMRADGYWLCACGQLNTSDNCIYCGLDFETVSYLNDKTMLEERAAVLNEEERRKQEELTQTRVERRQREQEEQAELERQRQERIAKAKQQATDLLTATKSGAVNLAHQTQSNLTPILKNLRKETIACPVCHANNAWDTSFCEECGATITAVNDATEGESDKTSSEENESKAVICEGCGCSNNAEDRFCANCGMSLASDNNMENTTADAAEDTETAVVDS